MIWLILAVDTLVQTVGNYRATIVFSLKNWTFQISYQFSRSIQQLQFVNWPDHGVPNDPSDFVDFVMRVNSIKNEEPQSPTLVHCSAGVGRTGPGRKLEVSFCSLASKIVPDSRDFAL